MHHFGRFDERALTATPVFEGHSRGYTTAPLINRHTGSVHTGLSIDQLASSGTIDPHVHSFEEERLMAADEIRFRDEVRRANWSGPEA